MIVSILSSLAVEMQSWMQLQAEQSSRKVLRLDSAGIPRPLQYKPDADRHLGEAVPLQEGAQHSSVRTNTLRSC